MRKLQNEHGAAALIVVLIIIAIALAAAVAVPIIKNKADEKLMEADDEYVVTATKEAKIIYLQNGGAAFSAVFNTEDKQFYPISGARSNVNTYGMSKENEGKFLLVRVSDTGETVCEWVYPNDLRTLPEYTDDSLDPP